MRKYAIAIILGFLAFPVTAQAKGHYVHTGRAHSFVSHRTVHVAHFRVAHHGRSYGHYGALAGPCYLAAHEGGPCGCHAEGYFFGRYDHVLNIGGRMVNLWKADTWWQVFPRTTAHVGAAAVWPGRHVAPVVDVPKAGYVTVADSWGTHTVKTAGLVFVDPR